MNFLSTLHLFLLSDSNMSAAHDATQSQKNLLDGSSVSSMWDTSKIVSALHAASILNPSSITAAPYLTLRYPTYFYCGLWTFNSHKTPEYLP